MRRFHASALVALLLPLAFVVAAEAVPPLAVARVAKSDEARRRLGLLPHYRFVPGIRKVKVAVLDSGFAGMNGKRPYLPDDTVIIEHYDPGFVRKFGLGDPNFTKPFRRGDAHGRQLAQIVWAAAGNASDGPKFFLLNANGPTMFRRAVRMAIEQKVDVILFGGTFEGAGNYDGRGPINAAVDDAVTAGIVWVNAAGNSGNMVFNGPVDVGPGGWVHFGALGLTALRLRSRLDENDVVLTLTWNDYQDAEDAGTSKDLDLIVEDWQGRVLAQSKLKQIGPGRAAGEGQTMNPRERLAISDLGATVAGREYRVRVKANGANFGRRDQLRILLTPLRPPVANDDGILEPAAELLEAIHAGEIYPPADHAGVLTVGDTSPASAVGPTADGRVKPDVIMSESVVRFTNGEVTAGASNAAAYFAGVVAVMLGTEPRLTVGEIRAWVRMLDRAAALAPGRVATDPGLRVTQNSRLTPNQLRALRFSGYALDEKIRRGDRDPAVVISSPGGEWLVRPGGLTPLAPPVVARAAPPADVAPKTVHAPWRTPTPRQLAEFAHGR